MKRLVSIFFFLFIFNSHANGQVYQHEFKNLSPRDFVVKLQSLTINKGLFIQQHNEELISIVPLSNPASLIELRMKIKNDRFYIQLENRNLVKSKYNLDRVLINIFKFWDLQKVKIKDVNQIIGKERFMGLKHNLFNSFDPSSRIVNSFNSLIILANGVALQIDINPIEESDQYIGIRVNDVSGNFKLSGNLNIFNAYKHHIINIVKACTRSHQLKNLTEFYANEDDLVMSNPGETVSNPGETVSQTIKEEAGDLDIDPDAFEGILDDNISISDMLLDPS